MDAFDYGMTGILPLAILLVVTVVTVIIKTDSLPLPDWLVHPYVTAARRRRGDLPRRRALLLERVRGHVGRVARTRPLPRRGRGRRWRRSAAGWRSATCAAASPTTSWSTTTTTTMTTTTTTISTTSTIRRRRTTTTTCDEEEDEDEDDLVRRANTSLADRRGAGLPAEQPGRPAPPDAERAPAGAATPGARHRPGHRPPHAAAAPGRSAAALTHPGYGRPHGRDDARRQGGRCWTSAGSGSVTGSSSRPARSCWCSASPCPGPAWSSRGSISAGAQNAFSYPFTGGVAWLLVVAAGVIAFLRAAELMGDGSIPWTRLTVLATALAVVLMLLRLILGPGGGNDRRRARARLGDDHRLPRQRRRPRRRVR